MCPLEIFKNSAADGTHVVNCLWCVDKSLWLLTCRRTNILQGYTTLKRMRTYLIKT